VFSPFLPKIKDSNLIWQSTFQIGLVFFIFLSKTLNTSLQQFGKDLTIFAKIQRCQPNLANNFPNWLTFFILGKNAEHTSPTIWQKT
jgi:hypothetical protein